METFLQNFLGDITDQYQSGGTAVVVVVLVVGLLLTFFGYKLQKFWISLAGFAVGFLLAFLITSAVNDSPQKDVYAILIGLAAGVFGGFLAFKLYKFGVFIYAAWSTYSVIYAVFPVGNSNMGIVVAIIAGVLAGFVAMAFIRPVLIVSSSLNGALYACTAVFTLANADMYSLYMVVAGLILAILGIAVQFGITKGVSAAK